MDLYVLRSQAQESRKVVFKKCFSVTLYSVLCTLYSVQSVWEVLSGLGKMET